MNSSQESNPSPLTEPQHAEVIGLLIHAYNNHLSAMLGHAELAQIEMAEQPGSERLADIITAGESAVVLGREILSAYARLQLPAQKVTIDDLAAAIGLMGIKTGTVPASKDFCKLNIDWFTYSLNKWLQLNAHCGVKAESLKLQMQARAQHLFLSVAGSNDDLTRSVSAEQLARPFYSSREIMGSKDVGVAVLYGYCQQLGGQCQFNSETAALEIKLPLYRD